MPISSDPMNEVLENVSAAHRQAVDHIAKRKRELEEQEQDIQAKRRSLDSHRQQVDEELTSRRDEIEGILGSLSKVVEEMRGHVKLNIGGIAFTTSAATLNKAEWFKNLLSGRFAIEKDSEGAIFIDRDGRYFAHILNYLRMGEAGLAGLNELSPGSKQQLLAEADFYQMPDFADKVKESMRSRMRLILRGDPAMWKPHCSHLFTFTVQLLSYSKGSGQWTVQVVSVDDHVKCVDVSTTAQTKTFSFAPTEFVCIGKRALDKGDDLVGMKFGATYSPVGWKDVVLLDDSSALPKMW